MLKKIKNLDKSKKILLLLALPCLIQAVLFGIFRYQRSAANELDINQTEKVDRSKNYWNETIDGEYHSKEDLLKKGYPLRKMKPQW